jgi:hypothetical protein
MQKVISEWFLCMPGIPVGRYAVQPLVELADGHATRGVNVSECIIPTYHVGT